MVLTDAARAVEESQRQQLGAAVHAARLKPGQHCSNVGLKHVGVHLV